jgi:hypothetical protein
MVRTRKQADRTPPKTELPAPSTVEAEYVADSTELLGALRCGHRAIVGGT